MKWQLVLSTKSSILQMLNLFVVFQKKVRFSLVVLLLISLLVAWEYFHGGVARHYFLHDENMPSFSNWWGLLSVPLAAWISISFIQKNMNTNQINESLKRRTVIGFIVAFLFGIMMCFLWNFKLENVMQFVILLPLLLSLFTTVHRPEIFLGFVLGMVFTFGGVLSVGFGIFLLVLSFLINGVVRKGVLFLWSRLNS